MKGLAIGTMIIVMLFVVVFGIILIFVFEIDKGIFDILSKFRLFAWLLGGETGG